ncbi:D-aminoacyl-tRNA deacylase [Pseudoalteromonas denitrificans]|uniref:D-aminoacyl-tRNA deacylase n=1 Tax=Pseudoalteromonas denitrificans DSM 6059 TaxID=1123010 RepID=A0A1I1RB49_9GAMM|nr:D-aminoacyl-tRNA deacylase [Pseudoalteromonas denitrificans]SFD31604.1 D-tyrosyl-tRNA(Tyr) deacylase [Pseudoalteromonas denitrificans DSM 6059]
MQALIQRVLEAKVVVDGKAIGEIKQGILVLLGIEKGDEEQKSDKLLKKVMGYRIFPDKEGKMNLSLKDIEGQLLVVSQFTLAADTKKGMRPSFSSAAVPSEGERLYNYFVSQAKEYASHVETGEFGADMKVHLVNDGPVTFRLES